MCCLLLEAYTVSLSYQGVKINAWLIIKRRRCLSSSRILSGLLPNDVCKNSALSFVKLQMHHLQLLDNIDQFRIYKTHCPNQFYNTVHLLTNKNWIVIHGENTVVVIKFVNSGKQCITVHYRMHFFTTGAILPEQTSWLSYNKLTKL